MYQEEWWTKRRGLEEIRRMLEHTKVTVGFCDTESKRLIAFARVLTDYVYKALVLEVIVEGGSRGQGLARALMDAVVGHRSSASVRHIELYCRPELASPYRKWGFSDWVICASRAELHEAPDSRARTSRRPTSEVKLCREDWRARLPWLPVVVRGLAALRR
jgi:hypothetical protein